MSQATPPSDRAALICRFLGIRDGHDDPAVLLGIESQAADAAVIAALQRRLAQVSEHPEARTFEADEVRMALHAAAARLLDMHLRTPRDAPAAAAETRGTDAGVLETSVRRALAMGGGWNRDSLQQILLHARAQGLPPEEVARLVTGMTRAAPGSAGTASTPPAPARRAQLPAPPPTVTEPSVIARPGEFAGETPLAEQVDPGVQLGKWILWGGITLVVSMVLLGGLAFMMTRPPATPNTTGATQATGATSTQETKELFPVGPGSAKSAESSLPPRNAVTNRIGDFTDLLRELRTCTEGFGANPTEATDRFVTVAKEISTRWPEAPPDSLAAAVSTAVEFVYRAGDDQTLASTAIDALATPAASVRSTQALSADEIAPAAWSAGIVSRLVKERDLPISVARRVRTVSRDLGDASFGEGENSFRAGALSALLVMAPRAIDASRRDAKEGKRAWETWIASLGAIDSRSGPVYTHAIVLTMENILTGEPEPTNDRAVFDAIAELTVALPWRAGDESRTALLHWFDSPAVSASDLYTVTTALAERSGAEHVDISMILSLAGDDSQRAELRDRYATIWSLTTAAGRDTIVRKWVESASGAKNAGVMDTPPDHMARAVGLARLNTAAWRLWTGGVEGVEEAIAAPMPQPPAVNPTVAPGGVVIGNWGIPLKFVNPDGTPTATSAWAVRYLGAGANIPERLSLLGQVSQTPPAIDAAVLVEEACRGSPAQVRQAARDLVLRYSADPVMINAVLDFAPLIPPTIDNSELLQQVSASRLPPVRDPQWRVATRRALVERLVQALSAGGVYGYADVMEQLFADTYSLRSGIRPPARPDPATVEQKPEADPTAPTKPSEEPGVLALSDAAATYRATWQRLASNLIPTGREPFTLSELASRRTTRLRLADGPVHQFAAEQLSAVELMAFVLVAERPARSGAVQRVMLDLQQARREARHIANQLEAVEQAALRLWLIRFGENEA